MWMLVLLETLLFLVLIDAPHVGLLLLLNRLGPASELYPIGASCIVFMDLYAREC